MHGLDEQYAIYYYSDEFFLSSVAPDLDVFLWRLFEATGDIDFARAIWISKRGQLDHCFTKSVLTEQPEALQIVSL